jgi:formylglycine-generating enzyme required for sulfatase activity
MLAMSNSAASAPLPAEDNLAPVPRPLAAWVDDPDNAKMLGLLGWFVGSMFAVVGLAAGAFFAGKIGRPPTPGTVSPGASASAAAAPTAAPPPAQAAAPTAEPPPMVASAAPTAEPPPVVASAAPTAEPPPVPAPAGMVLVRAGKFKMGSDDPDFKPWSPAHEVTLDAFCIDLFEVAAGDYKACVDSGTCKAPPKVPDFPRPESVPVEEHDKKLNALADFCTFGEPERARHPINCVPWDFADTYCKSQKKRLPTEAEWEFAARGPEERKFPWGNEMGDHTFMNACGTECTRWELSKGLKKSPRIYEADDGFFRTAPVGSFPKGKTPAGVYDLAGNVFEWTADWFETYKPEAVTNPTGAATGERRVARGGAFNSSFQTWVNSTFRFAQIPTASAPGVGFRCASTP